MQASEKARKYGCDGCDDNYATEYVDNDNEAMVMRDCDEKHDSDSETCVYSYICACHSRYTKYNNGRWMVDYVWLTTATIRFKIIGLADDDGPQLSMGLA